MYVSFNPAMSSSNIRFKANEATNFQELINRPGSFTTQTPAEKPAESAPAESASAEKKKSGIGKKILWTVAAAAAIAAALVALPVLFKKAFAIKETGELKGFKKYLQEGINGIKKFSDYVIDKGKSLVNKFKSKKDKPAVEPEATSSAKPEVPAEEPEVIPPKKPEKPIGDTPDDAEFENV